MIKTIEDIELLLSEKKIKDDIFLYLQEDDENEADFYEISIASTDYPYKVYNLTVFKTDEISIFQISINKRYHNLIYFPIIVKVSIGKFIASHTTGLYRVEKCFADLLYNKDLELITVDFYCDDSCEITRSVE